MSEWIDVNDVLPQIMKEVIIFDEYSGVGSANLHYEGDWFAPVSDWKYSKVTHWQPLPEPPKK